MPIRDVHLGRLGFVTTYESIEEALGGEIELSGRRATLGSLKPRGFSAAIPIHGAPDDTDPYAAGERMRRQVRALIQNHRARSEGFYLRVGFDAALNAWLMVGDADLAYDEGGRTFSSYRLQLGECYVLGTPRTERPARWLSLEDRRLGGTARDVRRIIYGEYFVAVPIVSQLILPVGASDIVGADRTPLSGLTVASTEGNLTALYGLAEGNAVSFAQAETDRHRGDVVIYDRKGFTALLPETAVAQNIVKNPSAEVDATGVANAAPTPSLGRYISRVAGDGVVGGACFEAGLTSMDSSGNHVAVFNGGVAPLSTWGFPVTPGRTLAFRSAAKAVKGTGSNLILQAQYYDAALASMGTFTLGGAGSKPTVTVLNRVSNPSAEYDLTGIANTGPGGVGTQTRITDDGALGEKTCVQIVATTTQAAAWLGVINGGATPVSNAVPVVAGNIVSLRAALKLVSGAGADALHLTGRFYDAAGAFISDVAASGTGHRGSVSSPTLGTWYELWGTATAPANAAFVAVRVLADSFDADVYVSVRATAMQATIVGSTTSFPAYERRAWTDLWGTHLVPVNAAYATIRVNWGGNGVAQPAAVRTDAMQVMEVPGANDFPEYHDGDSEGWGWVGTRHLSPSALVDAQQIGWEEIYGPDQDLTVGDIPLLVNGVCRVKWIAAQLCFSIERFTTTGTTQYVEKARFAPGSHPGGLVATLIDSRVVEWTPERAVIQAVFTNAVARIECFITLQRGWTEPVIEVYAEALPGQAAQQGLIRWATDAAAAWAVTGPSATTAAFLSSDPGAVWNNALLVGFDGATENWIAATRTDVSGENIAAAVVAASGGFYGRDDTALYGGAARKAIELRGGNTDTGYAGLRFMPTPAAPILIEAESIRFASGTTSQIADANGSASQVVQDTQAPAPPAYANGEQNFMPNPSTEYDEVGAVPYFWTSAPQANFRVDEFKRSLGYAVTGAGSLWMNGKSTGSANNDMYVELRDGANRIAATAAQAYTFAIVVYIVAQPSDSTVAELEWRDGAGNVISTTVSGPQSGTGFKVFTINATAPANTASVVPKVRFNVTSSGDTVQAYFDSVMFLKGTFTNPYYATPLYFDGDTAGYDWQATPGRSTSQKTLATPAATDTLRRTLTEALGLYGVWARVRGTAADSQVSLDVKLGADVVTGVTQRIGTGYSWVYLGAVDHQTTNEVLAVRAWRSGGTGNSILDRIVLQALFSTTFDNPREVGGRMLADSRSRPALARVA